MIVNEYNEAQVLELAREGLQVRFTKQGRMADRLYRLQERLRQLEQQNVALQAIIGRKEW